MRVSGGSVARLVGPRCATARESRIGWMRFMSNYFTAIAAGDALEHFAAMQQVRPTNLNGR